MATPAEPEKPAYIGRYRRVRKGEGADERSVCEKALLACIMHSCDAAIIIEQDPMFSYSMFSVPSLRLFAIKLMAEYKRSGKADIPVMIAQMEPEDAEAVSEAFADIAKYSPPVECARDAMSRIKALDAEGSLIGSKEEESESASVSEDKIRELQRYLKDKAKRGEQK